MTYEARVVESVSTFTIDSVLLTIRRADTEYLMRDGSWASIEPGMHVEPDSVGILIPRPAVEAVARALAEWQGHTSHADTEARVLREWLAVERARVDHLMESDR